MQFLFPIFLAASALIAIPIIIHLFYFRRFKKVYFTNVRFLKELKEETSSRSRLRNLLVLLARILSILFLVFAFAQPFIKGDEEERAGRRHVGIYIDNSFSMQALGQDVSILDIARKRAVQIISAFEESDRFLITTNDPIGRYDRLVDKNTALEFVEEVQPSPASRNHSQVADYLIRKMENGGDAVSSIYFISDFQKTQADLPDSLNWNISLIPVKAIQERNISIDTAWFESPVQLTGQIAKIIVKSSNFDNNPAQNVKISAIYQGENKPIGTLNLPANGASTDTLSLLIKDMGWQELALQISDYPIEFDDTYFLAFEIPDKLPVLIIHDGESNRYLNAAFRSNNYYQPEFQSSDRVNYAELQSMRLIVLNGLRKVSSGLAAELSTFLDKGGNIIYFPPARAGLDEVNSVLSALQSPGFASIDQGAFEGYGLNTNSFIYKDVFDKVPENLKLPISKSRYRINSGRIESLLGYRDGSIMLGMIDAGKGNVFISSVPLDTDVSNLATSAEILIPLLFRAPLQKREASPWSYTIGQNRGIEINMPNIRGDVSFLLSGPQTFIPAISKLGPRVILQADEQLSIQGVYTLSGGQNQIIGKYAFNYDRKESDPKCYSSSELSDQFPNYQILDYSTNLELASIISAQTRGIELWRWALILGLLFILAEILMLRFWKV
jgi:hypothetical protein